MDQEPMQTAGNDTPSFAAQAGQDLPHEVRTSLTVITLLSGNLDLFYERLDEEKRRQMIRDLRTQTQRLNELVVDLL